MFVVVVVVLCDYTAGGDLSADFGAQIASIKTELIHQNLSCVTFSALNSALQR